MRLAVVHQEATRHTVRCRTHEVVVDLPIDAGGTDQGMNAPELFCAALAACIGVYIVDHCKSSGTPHAGLQLQADWRIAERPRRISELCIHIDLSGARLDATQREGILSAARRCLLSSTLLNSPSLQLHLHAAPL